MADSAPTNKGFGQRVLRDVFGITTITQYGIGGPVADAEQLLKARDVVLRRLHAPRTYDMPERLLPISAAQNNNRKLPPTRS